MLLTNYLVTQTMGQDDMAPFPVQTNSCAGRQRPSRIDMQHEDLEGYWQLSELR